MFNQTNLIIGAIYSVSAVAGGLIVLGVYKLTQNEYRIERKAAQKAIASMDDYIQSEYHKRVNQTLELIEDSDIQPEIAEKLLDLLNRPL